MAELRRARIVLEPSPGVEVGVIATLVGEWAGGEGGRELEVRLSAVRREGGGALGTALLLAASMWARGGGAYEAWAGAEWVGGNAGAAPGSGRMTGGGIEP